MNQIKQLVDAVKRNTRNGTTLSNNTQRVGLRLLSVNGEWVPRYRLTEVPSGAARVRDLRKAAYGGFQVECKSSVELNKHTSKKTYYYRIIPNTVKQEQVAILFSR